MDTVSTDVNLRLPTDPYPGLRPFLDHEAALLFGRERQIAEVIERLRQTQFIAVLGGSGSGKSSLIRAGVVPELRSFGIPGAGDFWLTVVSTPGTNVLEPEFSGHSHSPIDRLAWKFAKLLRSRGSPEADTARLEEIARVFRQEAGFARLVDAYGDEIFIPSGPEAKDARLLFVIDQFEELFHPTNKGVEDCGLMVERVIDHFFAPHPRCYVVLTMRSEHLSDCAGFLELPDAINKSSYLVRRLDEEELRDAIVGPAQRFLRLQIRQASEAGHLPEAVSFEEKVVERLLRDVRALIHDPDHLPLLQHLLARLWEVACERGGPDTVVPVEIEWRDLARATSPAAASENIAIDEKANTLRASLENWPERLYNRRTPELRLQLDALLRRLAFKDPNTGTYTQQRIDVDHDTRCLGEGKTRADLWALIEDGFVGSVDYLFWDDENPARVTLKVSHEAFIRGWSRFRSLIDREAERFEEFRAVLRKCAAWSSGARARDLLLEGAELRRLRDAELEEIFAKREERGEWFRFLLLDREGARLAKFEPEIDEYLRVSRDRQQAIAATRKHNRALLVGVGALALALALPTLFSLLIQAPVLERAQFFFRAGGLANQAQLSPNYPGIGAASKALQPLVNAAELIEKGKSGEGFLGRTSEVLLDKLSWIPTVKRQDIFLSEAAAVVEPPVNGTLRTLLSTALWSTQARAGTAEKMERIQPQSANCLILDASKQARVPGRLFLGRKRPNESVQRGIFVPQSSAGNLDIRDAVYSGGGSEGGCRSDHIVLPVPRFLEPRVLFDANLNYMLVSQSGPNVERSSVVLHEIDWERTEEGWGAQARTIAVVTDDQAVASVQRQAGKDEVQSVETWRMLGGRAFSVDDQGWRVITASAYRLDAKPDGTEMLALDPAITGSPCDNLLGAVGKSQAGLDAEDVKMFTDGRHCFSITRGKPPAPAQPGASPATVSTRNANAAPSVSSGQDQRTEVLVAVYGQPRSDETAGSLKKTLPAPIASLQQFGRFEKDQNRWYIGKSGAYEGWIALLRPTPSGERYFGAPWSTEALTRLGNEVLQRAHSRPPGSSL